MLKEMDDVYKILLDTNTISQAQLDAARQENEAQGTGNLGDTLVKQNVLSMADLLKARAQVLNMRYIDLNFYDYHEETIHLLSEPHARQYQAIVLEETPTGLLVGMVDPLDILSQDAIKRVLKRPVEFVYVERQAMERMFSQAYRRTVEISEHAERLGADLGVKTFSFEELEYNDEDAPVVRLVQSIFEDAVQAGASDVHIEPQENELRIRQRVDGLLQQQVIKEHAITAALVQRLKLMAKLDISECRLPQDGRLKVKIRGNHIDVRLSTVPVVDGEAVVMRLLNRSAAQLSLEDVGLGDTLLATWRKLLSAPNGVVLVTGPTGSGKTTTLYSALNELNQTEKKLITVEDPVEYQLEGVNQIQVHTKLGLSFARVLRSVLRQDPDIVMIGEIRDAETAEIASRAALTGHLVLATLHTNDAPSTATRLLDMGVPGYLIASTLRGVLAQRLVRRVCSTCAQSYTPTAEEQEKLKILMRRECNLSGFKKGTGCAACNHTGQLGRTGAFELLKITPLMMEALNAGDASAFHKAVETDHAGGTLVDYALGLAESGVINLDELFRLAGGVI